MILNWFGQAKKRKQAATGLFYIALLQSRHPAFYASLGIADTIDGRFDLLNLHIVLIIMRLKAFGHKGQRLSQALFDTMFKRMELDLREMGIGDLGVPKHMERMMKAFNGRRESYESAFNDDQSLRRTLARNIFRSEKASDGPQMTRFAAYVKDSLQYLETCSLDDLETGKIVFPDLAYLIGGSSHAA